jgi:hypothetical protein
MGTLAEAVLAALRGFASEVGTWTNQGSLVSIEGHIAQVESAVVQDVHAGETAAKAVLADLYGAFHGHIAAPVEAPAPAAPVITPIPGANLTATVPVPAQTLTVTQNPDGTASAVPAAPVAAPVAADPTPAPSPTTEASSAPSSTSSASTDAPSVIAPAAQ